MTLRKQMADMLREGYYTAKDLSKILGIREKEVYEHLYHVEKSMGNISIISEPAKCLNCGFEFKKRHRFTSPGKCPVCKSEHISAPVYGTKE